MKQRQLAKLAICGLGVFFISILFSPFLSLQAKTQTSSEKTPSVLIVYDGPNQEGNPGRLDALYLGNLLGHFTTRRHLIPIEAYRTGMWKSYDAVFCGIYQKEFEVPETFLRDAAVIDRPFCWFGQQTGQLDQFNILLDHGLHFERFFENSPFEKVRYKNRLLEKGDPDTNILKVVDPTKVQVFADAVSSGSISVPYIVRSGNFWVVTDSPFSYSGENDRYLAFADVLHDILGIPHKEDHRAIFRVEDINALSDPGSLKTVLNIIKHEKIPFAFGFVPVYVNPGERIYTHLNEHPDVVSVLKEYVKSGGVPVLHGYTHQHRGISTDDYEFWDDITDRPVRGDSAGWAYRRIEEAVREAFECEIYPATWETPHYAGSAATYQAVAQVFNTVFERRLAEGHLGTDQFFPYPVIDLKGQFVIPESLGYIPKDDQDPKILLDCAEAELAVRDGWASGFVHPFLNPQVIGQVIQGIKKLGFKFENIRTFPNRVQIPGRLCTNVPGKYSLGGEGRFLTEITLSPNGVEKSRSTREVDPNQPITVKAAPNPAETFVVLRQTTREATFVEKLWRLAKGDVDVLHHGLENVLPWEPIPPSFRTVVIWDSRAIGAPDVDQKSFLAMLSNLGFDIEQKPFSKFDENDTQPYTLLVIPNASARKLTDAQINLTVRALEEGLTILTDGESPLATALGIRLGLPAPVGQLFDHSNWTQNLRWPDHPYVDWIEEPSTEDPGITPYYSERDSGRPLVIGGSRGQGRFLYFAPLFDPVSGFGYSRFPGVPFIIVNDFRLHPSVRRSAAEAYFDPGYRQNISVERLTKMWRQFGIRVIHAAAWHFYDKYSYDYGRLIKSAHQNGILVYAWFEWPHVSQRFWNEHPQWREKNGLLADAHIDWRHLMNLSDPKCFDAVMKDAEDLIRKYDWDGVNLAEFHFEGTSSYDPARFTPFDSLNREKFKSSQGFDPVDLFNENSPRFWKKDLTALKAFFHYRKGVNNKIVKLALRKLDTINHQINPNHETILTIIDTLKHPELGNLLAIDLEPTINLANQISATLQIEDPGPEWSLAPTRYRDLVDHYRKLSLKTPFMVDINVLPVHPETQKGFATAQPTGTEFLTLWQEAALWGNRVCLYSESSIFEPDWEILPYAMANSADVRKEGDEWIIHSPWTVTIETGRGSKRCLLDGHPWPCYSKNSVLIPPGEHRLSFARTASRWFDLSELNIRLSAISGELLGAEQTSRGLMLEYRSGGRCWALFNKEPSGLVIDDQAAKISSLKGDDGFAVYLPSGQHRLFVSAGSPFIFFMQYLSVVSGSLIVLFGATSSGLLLIMYMLIKLGRRARHVGKSFRRKKPKAVT